MIQLSVTLFSLFQPNWSGNRKGLVGPLKEGVVLDILSARLNFT
jgi:hypothetical protein